MGVLVGYKVEILVGLRVTSPSRITCRESYLDYVFFSLLRGEPYGSRIDSRVEFVLSLVYMD